MKRLVKSAEQSDTRRDESLRPSSDTLDRLVGLIEAWRREGDDLWKNSLMAAARQDDTERVRLQDRCSILFRNANQLERLVQPNANLHRTKMDGDNVEDSE